MKWQRGVHIQPETARAAEVAEAVEVDLKVPGQQQAVKSLVPEKWFLPRAGESDVVRSAICAQNDSG